ncbi:hypothetical protein MP638_006763 [Amoeboaphelidium occidentale]|nr:hypothetical protein MP638_006763 [Amoeboaphelidium occidentale]
MSAQRRQRFAGTRSRSFPPSSANSLYTIYVLECKQGKFYVGKTTKPVETRFAEHLKNPTGWTSFYEPIGIVETFDRKESYFEDYVTKSYMGLYGIENVRGGSYTQVRLRSDQITAIQLEQLSAENKCHNCHRAGHFAKQCRAASRNSATQTRQTRAPVTNARSSLPARESPSYSSSSSSSGNERRLACFRCGRTSHLEENCYAKTHVNGKYLGTRNYNEGSD